MYTLSVEIRLEYHTPLIWLSTSLLLSSHIVIYISGSFAFHLDLSKHMTFYGSLSGCWYQYLPLIPLGLELLNSLYYNIVTVLQHSTSVNNLLLNELFSNNPISIGPSVSYWNLSWHRWLHEKGIQIEESTEFNESGYRVESPCMSIIYHQGPEYVWLRWKINLLWEQ